MSFTVVLLSGRRGVGQQRHLAGVLHRDRDAALVLPAVAGDAPGADLAAVGDELPEQAGVLVVDVLRRVLAERADLLLRLAQHGFGHGCSWWYSEPAGDRRVGGLERAGGRKAARRRPGRSPAGGAGPTGGGRR